MRKKTRTKNAISANLGGFTFDADAADRAVEFFARYLHHVKGEWAGQPLVLDEWQKEQLIRPLFGWKRADGTRKHRKVYVEIPRKNAKSTIGAGLGLYLLLADGEPGAEIYSCAADRDQAALVFDIARQMVESDLALARRCEVYRRSIVVPSTGSAYHVLSADAPTKHGKNSHAVIFDELHAQPNRELYDVMTTSQGSRRQPVFVMLTTAGYDRKSICWDEHQYACKVRDGVLKDDSYLPVIYSASEEADRTDEKVWEAANPGLNHSIKLEFLRDEFTKAKDSPAYQNTFRRLYLNQWTEQATRWIDMAAWEACDVRFDPDEMRGKRCFIGLDLASTTDIAAEALVFPPEDDLVWRVMWRFWIPEANMRKRVTRDRVPYDVWVRDGLIETTSGNIIEYEAIKARIIEDCQEFDVQEIVYDRWGATQLITGLMSEGLQCVPFGQGFQSMAAPTKELEKLILGRLVSHNNHPVAAWMMSNVAVRQDPAGNIKPDKSKSTEKIDGIVALIMGLGRAMVSDTSGSVYEKNEPIWVNLA